MTRLRSSSAPTNRRGGSGRCPTTLLALFGAASAAAWLGWTSSIEPLSLGQRPVKGRAGLSWRPALDSPGMTKDAWTSLEGAARRRSATCSRPSPTAGAHGHRGKRHPLRFLQDPLSRGLIAAFLRPPTKRASRRDATPCSPAISSTRTRAAPPSIAPSAGRGRRSVARAAGFPRPDAGDDRCDRGRRVRPGGPHLHIGIGGSALGPHLLIDALGRKGDATKPPSSPMWTASLLEDAIFALRSRGDPDRHCVEDLHHHRDPAQRALGAAVARRGRNRRPVRARDRAHPRTPSRRSSSASTDENIAVFRKRGGRYSLLVDNRVPRRSGLGLGCVRDTARGRGGDGPPVPLRAPGANAPVLAPSSTAFTQSPRRRDPRVFAYDEAAAAPVLPPAARDGIGGKRVTLDGDPRSRRLAHRLGRVGHRRPATASSNCSTRARISCRWSSSPPSSRRDSLDPDHHHHLLINCFPRARR